MIKVRKFMASDAKSVAEVVTETLLETNQKDYSSDYIQAEIKLMNRNFFLQKAKETHFYVVVDNEKIVGTGAIGSFWGSQTESSLFDIFVLPAFQGQGIGRLIIQTLENDPYFTRATRIEIPASITAVAFYQKMGYQLKNHQAEPDQEQLYRLEKFPQSNG